MMIRYCLFLIIPIIVFQVFNAISGEYVRSIGNGHGNGLGQFQYPYGLVLLSACEQSAISLLFVSDQMNRRIQVFNSMTGEFIRIFV